MGFNVNSPVLYVLAGLIVAAVLAQSVYFLVKAWRRGLELGMSRDKLSDFTFADGIYTL